MFKLKAVLLIEIFCCPAYVNFIHCMICIYLQNKVRFSRPKLFLIMPVLIFISFYLSLYYTSHIRCSAITHSQSLQCQKGKNKFYDCKIKKCFVYTTSCLSPDERAQIRAPHLINAVCKFRKFLFRLFKTFMGHSVHIFIQNMSFTVKSFCIL